MSAAAAVTPKIVSQKEWMAAHKGHLEKEKLLTRLRDDLSRERRSLPWVKVQKNYLFEGANGKETLDSLFEGRSQLIVYHFMFGPEWEEGCPSCSLVADHIAPSAVHLAQRDVTLVAVARASWSRLEPFQARMGWRLKFVSSYGSDFNRDYHVFFTAEETANSTTYYNFATTPFPAEEAPGLSVFYKDETGDIFHTFSAYGRGGEPLLGVYHLLDLTPKGRNEEGLSFPMSWVRHHDRYPDAQKAVVNGCCTHEKEPQ